jgi:hypothetical protein
MSAHKIELMRIFLGIPVLEAHEFNRANRLRFPLPCMGMTTRFQCESQLPEEWAVIGDELDAPSTLHFVMALPQGEATPATDERQKALIVRMDNYYEYFYGSPVYMNLQITPVRVHRVYHKADGQVERVVTVYHFVSVNGVYDNDFSA